MPLYVHNLLTPYPLCFNALAMSGDMSTYSAKAPLPAIFGPTLWHEKAARILGISHRQAFKIAQGVHGLTRRQRAIVETYLENRRRGQSTELKAAIEAATKRHKALQQGLIEAQGWIVAAKAESRRQGRL